jgi:hypothetical protein
VSDTAADAPGDERVTVGDSAVAALVAAAEAGGERDARSSSEQRSDGGVASEERAVAEGCGDEWPGVTGR